jgi:Flp pilus assembly protein TadG
MEALTEHDAMTRFNFSRQRGAVLIHVAVAMLGLLSFSALVIDYGIFWASRRQAQNSADAGALAGAMGLAYDDPTDFSDTGPAKIAARGAALANLVFGAPPDVNITTDITFPPCPDDASDTCIKVDVYRTVARGNPLPTFFARLVGIVEQDMKATATAKVLQGNATQCMRPFGILDKWDEWNEKDVANEYDYNNHPEKIDNDWNSVDSSFDKYDVKGSTKTIEPDLYVPHSGCSPAGGPTGETECAVGTGFRLFDDDGNSIDYGREIQIKTGAQDQTSAGYFMPVQLKPTDSGAKDYCNNIKGCSGVTNLIGQTIDTENGNMVGPTDACLWTDSDSLYSQDTSAHWDPTALGGAGAVVSDDYGANASPRIVPLPVISPEVFFASDPNGHTSMVIENILGFFIEGTIDKSGVRTYGPPSDKGGGGQVLTFGRLVTVPGFFAGGNVVDPSASFIKVIVLIR